MENKLLAVRAVLAPLVLFFSVFAYANAQVVELSADELLPFVAKHPAAVVQLNSSDPRCGYCVGADKLFDEIAAKPYAKPVVFARVQWPRPWRNIPLYPGAFSIDGIPAIKVFHLGKVVSEASGKPRDRNEVFRVMNAGFENVRTRPVP